MSKVKPFTTDDAVRIQRAQLNEAIENLRCIAENIDLAILILEKKALESRETVMLNSLTPYAIWRGVDIDSYIANNLGFEINKLLSE